MRLGRRPSFFARVFAAASLDAFHDETALSQATPFDRGVADLAMRSVAPLTVDDAVVVEAAAFLGLG